MSADMHGIITIIGCFVIIGTADGFDIIEGFVYMTTAVGFIDTSIRSFDLMKGIGV